MDKKELEFHCIILAAGYGKRIESIARGLPKSLLKISEVTLLESHLDNLLKHPIKHISIIVGYKNYKIRNLIGNEYGGIPIEYIESKDYMNTNHSWSIYLSKNFVSKKRLPLIFLHADTFYDPSLLSKVIYSKFENTILADPSFKINTRDELIVTGENNVVNNLHYVTEGYDNLVGEFIGIHKFSLDFTLDYFVFLKNYFQLNGKNDGYDWLLGKFIYHSNLTLNYQTISNEAWININHEEDYYNAQKISKRIKLKV
tara:strand:+ start:28521 stop:29291 length:771 start_codon:yes stop_codon:yes gene_type:complete